MYEVKVNNRLEEAADQEEYRQLVEDTESSTVFTDWPWLTTTTKYSRAEQHFFLSCESHGKLVGFVSLKVQSESLHGIPAKVCRFIQYPWGDRIAVLIHPDHLAAWPKLLEKLHELSRREWDCMIWNEWFDPNGLRDQAHAFCAQVGWGFYQRLTSHCPVFYLEGRSEDEITASYTSKLRSDLKRRKKKLAKLEGKIEHLRPTAAQVDELIDKMKYTEAQSWKGEEGVGIFNDPEGAEFFAEASRALAQADQLDLSLIWIDGELASYKYGFYFHNTFFDYSIGYLPEYKKLGLGRVLLDEMVLAGAREGYDAVDASRVGAVSNHLLFERTDKTVQHHRAYWFSGGMKGKLLQVLVVYLKPKMAALRDRYVQWQRDRGAITTKAER